MIKHLRINGVEVTKRHVFDVCAGRPLQTFFNRKRESFGTGIETRNRNRNRSNDAQRYPSPTLATSWTSGFSGLVAGCRTLVSAM